MAKRFADRNGKRRRLVEGGRESEENEEFEFE